MKPLFHLAGLMALTLLVACHSYSPQQYLQENITARNSLVTETKQWISGDYSQSLYTAQEQHKGFKSLQSALTQARENAEKIRQEQNAISPPDDAKDLHAKLLAALDAAIAQYDAMLKLTDLPDGFSDEQAQPLQHAINAATAKFAVLSSQVEQAQMAYAQQHQIDLSKLPASL